MAFHLPSQINLTEQTTGLFSSIGFKSQAGDSSGSCHGHTSSAIREYEADFLPLEASADLALLTSLCG